MLKTYAAELKDGLADKLKNNSIAYTIKGSEFVPTPDLELKYKSAAKIDGKMDLFFMTSILASVGWNANDDVFDKVYTWNARNTASHKPVNFMHNEADIIGHMVDCAVLNNEGKVIASDNDENIPDQYDIAVSAYLYKKWENPEAQARMDTLLAEIKEGKWCVSMECLFADFDYAIITPDGSHKVVARNEESAFLTKHLRVYGGTGEFNGNKIGRLLKDFAFSGKGIVDNPANKRSIIFQDNVIFNGTTASVQILSKGKKNKMDESKVIEELKRDLAEAKAENKTLQDKAKAESDAANAAKISGLEAEVTESKKVAKASDEKVAALTAEINTKTEAVKALETELATLKSEIVKAKRLAKLSTAGVTGEDADKFITKFASASDEIFEEFVNLHAAKKAAEDNFKKSADEKSKSEDIDKDDKGEGAAKAGDIEGLKTEEQTPTPTPEDKANELHTKASTWISSNLFSTKGE